jgi:hypothetical protein
MTVTMNSHHCARALLALLCTALAFPTFSIETFPESNGEPVPFAELRAAQSDRAAELQAALGARPPVAKILRLTAAELKDIERQNERAPQGAPLRTGTVKPLDIEVDFVEAFPSSLSATPQAVDLGIARRSSASSLVWGLALDVDAADGIRLKLEDVSLPAGASLYLYNNDGEVRGPYQGDLGSFWTHSIRGGTVYLQLDIPGANDVKTLQLRFRISEALLIAPSTNSLCTNNAYCIQDASCYDRTDWPAIDLARKGVALFTFIKNAAGYQCTGGLLNDTDRRGFIPYFLTANHCVSTQSVANTVETYFNYETSYCGAPCGSRGIPTTLGATLLHTSAEDDHTLLRLNEAPPTGSYFLGWNSAPVASIDGTELYRLSHPRGSPQAYSRHQVLTSGPYCPPLPRGRYIYSLDIIGATEPGSSGSPVMTSHGQVVGQLLGACGSNLSDFCDSVRNSTVDGAFANYYSDIAFWLNPPINTWTQIPGKLSQVTTGDLNGDGWDDIVGVTSDGYIFYTTNLRNWNSLPGRLAQIASGDLNNDGRDDLAGVTGEGHIFYTTNLRNWTYIPGLLAQVTTGDLNGDGQEDLAGVTKNGDIFYSNNLRTWSYIPGRLAQVASGDLNNDGRDDLVGVTSDGFIFYATNLRNWNYIPGRLAQVITGDFNKDGRDDLVGTIGEGYIFYTTNLRTWTNVPGRLAQVATGNLDGSGGDDLAGVTAVGDIFYNTGVAP